MKKIPCVPRSVESWTRVPSSRYMNRQSQNLNRFRYAPVLHIFKSKNEKAPYRGRGDLPPHPSPRSVATLPRAWVASLPRKDVCPSKCFGSITPLYRNRFWWASDLTQTIGHESMQHFLNTFETFTAIGTTIVAFSSQSWIAPEVLQ